jgi:hypothetical protein
MVGLSAQHMSVQQHQNNALRFNTIRDKQWEIDTDAG